MINELRHINVAAILSILFLAWCSSILGNSAWNYLLSKYNTSYITPLTMLVPVVGIVLSWVVLHEKLNLMQLTGSLLIITGLTIINLGLKPIDELKWKHQKKDAVR